MSERTRGPWYWTREKINDTWYATLLGQPNRMHDPLVTAMREDLAAFPYAIDTANAKLIAKAPEMFDLLKLVSARLAIEESEHPGETYILAAYRQEITALVKSLEEEA